MSQKISRRELGRRGAIGLAALALPGAALAQSTPTPPPPPVSDAEMDAIEKQLANPLSAEAKKLLKPAVENSKGNSIARKKFKLEDCSEPATVYHIQLRDRVNP